LREGRWRGGVCMSRVFGWWWWRVDGGAEWTGRVGWIVWIVSEVGREF
jgi:hypothetical protein